MQLIHVFYWQVDVVFEEVDEIVLEDPELPFIAGRLAEPVQPNLVRMRELLAASKCNVMLVDGIDQVSASLPNLHCRCIHGAAPVSLSNWGDHSFNNDCMGLNASYIKLYC